MNYFDDLQICYYDKPPLPLPSLYGTGDADETH